MIESNNKSRGFTLAELVIAMAIVTILTAAFVPMIKYNKLRPRESFTPHGIYECFYDGDTLYSFKRDNDKNNVGVETPETGSCTFPVPKANYYELHIIGAGEDGGGIDYNNIKPETDKKEPPEYKTFNVDKSFKSKLKGWSYPAYNIWKECKTKIEITFAIIPPIGSGGHTKTEMVPMGQPDGSFTYEQKDIEYGYGNAADENGVKLEHLINLDTKINTASVPNTFDTSSVEVLKIDDTTLATMYGTMSTGGDNTTNRGMCKGFKKSQDNHNCTNEVYIKTSDGTQSLPTKKSRDTSTNGAIKAPVTFTYKPVTLTYKYGSAGVSGTRTKLYFEKIKAKNLEFTPEKTYGTNRDAVKTSDGKVLYKYKSATPSEIKSQTIEDFSYIDLPIPEEFKNNYSEVIPKVYDYYSAYCAMEGRQKGKGLCNREINPGKPGVGGYPLLIDYIDKVSELTAKVGDATTAIKPEDYSKYNTYSEDCYGKEFGQTRGENENYCKGTKGTSGAIILIW